MQFRFENSELADLYHKETGVAAYPESVVESFFKKMQIIKGVKNENDLRAIKGNHCEKIKGEENKYSIRLNKGFRLEFGLEKGGECTILLIRDISNHYS